MVVAHPRRLESPHGEHALDGRHVRRVEAAPHLRAVEPAVGADHALDLGLALVVHGAPRVAIDGIDPEQLSGARGEPHLRGAAPASVASLWSTLLAASVGSVPAGRSNVIPYARRYPSGVGRTCRAARSCPGIAPEAGQGEGDGGRDLAAPGTRLLGVRGAQGLEHQPRPALVEGRAPDLDRGVAGAGQLRPVLLLTTTRSWSPWKRRTRCWPT